MSGSAGWLYRAFLGAIRSNEAGVTGQGFHLCSHFTRSAASEGSWESGHAARAMQRAEMAGLGYGKVTANLIALLLADPRGSQSHNLQCQHSLTVVSMASKAWYRVLWANAVYWLYSPVPESSVGEQAWRGRLSYSSVLRQPRQGRRHRTGFAPTRCGPIFLVLDLHLALNGQHTLWPPPLLLHSQRAGSSPCWLPFH